MWLTKLRLINLLIIMNSDLLQLCLKQVDPISVTSVESIFSELLHLAIGHLLGFFDLLGIELDLTWVDGSCCSSINISIWFKIVWIHVAIVIRVSLLLLSFLWLASSCSSVLLSNPTFQLIHGNFFKLLSHELFFLEPRIFSLPVLIPVYSTSSWSLWRTTLALRRIRLPLIGRCHIKHQIVQFIMVVVVVIRVAFVIP